MSWLYAQTWLWYLIAFVVGVLLAWLFLVLPQQRRLRTLQRRGAPTSTTTSTPTPQPRSGVRRRGRHRRRPVRLRGPRTGHRRRTEPAGPGHRPAPPASSRTRVPDTTELPVQPAPDDTATGEIPVLADADPDTNSTPGPGRGGRRADRPAADAPPATGHRPAGAVDEIPAGREQRPARHQTRAGQRGSSRRRGRSPTGPTSGEHRRRRAADETATGAPTAWTAAGGRHPRPLPGVGPGRSGRRRARRRVHDQGQRGLDAVPHPGLAVLRADEGRGVVPGTRGRRGGRLHQLDQEQVTRTANGAPGMSPGAPSV